MNTELTFSRLVDTLTQKIFRGWLPADADTIISALFVAVPCLRDEPDPRARQAFREELELEIRARLAVQESLVIFNQVTFLELAPQAIARVQVPSATSKKRCIPLQQSRRDQDWK